MKKINIPALIVCLIVPLAAGGLAALLSMPFQDIFDEIRNPPLQPPSIVFPIVWTILYTLTGISAYLIYTADAKSSLKTAALTVCGISIALNFVWPLVFFNAEAFFAAFFVLIALWLTVFVTIIMYYIIRPSAAYLQVPYLLWLTFAGYLNYMTYVLNPG